MFSNRYIFAYTAILVVVVAVVLALAATLLQPMQTRNQDVAKMQEILKSAGIEVDAGNAASTYDSVISSEMMVDRKGNVKGEYRNRDGKWERAQGDLSVRRAFDCNVKVEFDKAARFDRGQGPDGLFPVFVCRNGIRIVPLQGKGLWGAIWGYVALEKDGNTVAGVTFGHKGETPGLGAEIAEKNFQSHFVGKKLFDESGNFVSITVQKGGAEKYPGDISHAVDAISGGTITSKGVTSMLADCLGYYVPFLEKGRQIRKVRPAVMPADTGAMPDSLSVSAL